MEKKINYNIFFIFIFWGIILFFNETTYAAITGQETKIQLMDGYVGRYKMNYTGNTNHYATWNNSGTAPIGNLNYIYNDVAGYANSSTANLQKTAGASGIEYAFLVWETRSPRGTTDPVGFIMPNGQKTPIFPTYAINDWRDSGNGSWAYQTMYCMATDVTSIVKSAGYGNYSVCNIPRYNGGAGGGESVGSWQLIVVEEGDDFPVRVVSLSMGSEFRAPGLTVSKDYSGDLNLTSGLKSKATGAATGQIFFGATNPGTSVPMLQSITAYDSSGAFIKQAVANSTYCAGLYRNGSVFNTRDYAPGAEYGRGGIRMDLSDVSDIGNNVSRLHLNVMNDNWTSFFFLGAAIDIAYPDFVGTQTTTVNNSTSATVTGQFTNKAVISDTGIYNGNLTVEIDSGLTPTSATAVVNGTITVNGTIRGNSVTFNDSAVASMMNGSSISYTIQCSTGNSGKTVFHNSAGFHGYLRSDGVNTGYWINKMWTAESSAAVKYKVIINQGTGIETVTGSGEYACGTTVKPTAALKPGYHWSSWTGSYTTTQQDYSFQMPAGDVALTANGEANQYTIVFDSNEGEGHMDSITATYDVPLALPANAFTRKNDYGPSVFKGWNVIADTFEELYPNEAELINLTEENNGTVTLYAIWDDTPWIIADDLYYTLYQAQTGFITREELMSHASAEDREDGVILPEETPDIEEIPDGEETPDTEEIPNTEETPDEEGTPDTEASPDGEETPDTEEIPDAEAGKWTSFEIIDYQESDFTQFQHEGSVTETFKVTDSIGNTYQKMITVYIVDTTAVAVKPEGTTRFINEKYYNESYENGGLEDNSIWKTDPEYKASLQSAFDNLKNDTPEQSYTFTHDDILKMKEFVKENGIGNIQSEDALSRFYEQFILNN